MCLLGLSNHTKEYNKVPQIKIIYLIYMQNAFKTLCGTSKIRSQPLQIFALESRKERNNKALLDQICFPINEIYLRLL